MHGGSCHCGRLALEVEGEVTGALSRTCSLCQRRGSLLCFVPRDGLRLLSPEDAASTCTFNTHAIKHRFCPRCGMRPYSGWMHARYAS